MLRTKVLQEKLPALSTKCIESDWLQSFLFQDIMIDFALEKSGENKL
jgi:hypothetical protein